MIEGTVSDRKKLLTEELNRIVKILSDMGVSRVLAFGSFVTGKTGMESDLDLIVVMKTQERFIDRLVRIYTAVDPKIAVDILVYTPDEFKKMSSNNPLIRQAVKEGKVVYES
ncbi:MAG TPA: nucleotidyltransferase domain-containing protein [Kosmotogaceae bacterium]|nr:nucleotidyltransferase domain-containing protein [Kosmotogaceae bacterium]